MFISNLEKSRIETRLASLETRVEQLARSLNALHDAQSMASDPKTVTSQSKKLTPNQSTWSADKRAAQSARMKQRWVEKKAAATVNTTQPTQE